MSRILVTGGCGFIGHNVVERLQSMGHQVRIADSMTDYGIIPDDEHGYLLSERKKKFQPNTLIHEVSIEGVGGRLAIEMFRPEIVIHLASMPRQRIVNSNPRLGSEVMVGGLINLLEESVKQDVRKFVYISSSMVYGDFTDNVTEDAICNPQGSYAIMKYMGEQLVKDYSRRGLLDHTIIRPSAVYGPLDIEDRVISKFMFGAMREEVLQVNGPNEKLDFSYVGDVAAGIVAAALSSNTDNQTYNITRSKSITLIEAATRVIELTGKGSIKINERDLEFPTRGSLNIDKARKDFDYQPTVDFTDGLSEYHSWILASSFWRQKLKL
jgi:nucleoside-diphosphate-sugar epimerase